MSRAPRRLPTQLLSLLLIALMLGRQRRPDATARGGVRRTSGSRGGRRGAGARDGRQVAAPGGGVRREESHPVLGRGPMWPIAMEGALKLRRDSRTSTPRPMRQASSNTVRWRSSMRKCRLIVVAPNNDLLDKLKANMQVVRARGGQALCVRRSRDRPQIRAGNDGD